MAGETTIRVVGNLTADPELRFTQSGAAVASFTVASTPRTFDKNSGEWKDGEALFLRCSLWRQVAEIGPSLRYATFRRVFKNSEGGSEENPSEEPSF
ncbi:single-stranded DNA-binding protein [Lentzea sp. NBC_00516]|uniref:single-stranded DNA-binding protein n=1 Tax=Lentzea sp. NBC_00516 TaxID=2903582 RepID=UPI002E824752|nr:single-stranded DNA-binding protein [Lentzea sp. NBC_00516]WUD28531.1 single-stranded DNA-binding protein [Lentzea sp. NBC_00516]